MYKVNASKSLDLEKLDNLKMEQKIEFSFF